MKQSAIVIGAGIAGIAAAIRLKAKGFDVSVFEANAYPGGKLSEFQQGAYRFDAGPSLFTMPHFVDELFELMGEKPSEKFEYIKMNTACHYFFEDGLNFESPSNPEAFAQLLKDQLGEDKEQVLKFLNKSKTMYDITAPVFLQNSLHRLKTYFSKTGIKGILNLWRLNMFKSMNQINSQTFRNPKTVQFFNRFATYNGSNPYIAPATLNIIPHLEFGVGTFFPVKGMNSITQSLFELAQRHGVAFHFNAKVNRITNEKNKATGIEVGGKIMLADTIVSNMDVFPTYKKLLPQFDIPKQVKHVESSSSALIFYWGINHSFKELGLHNILFSEDYKKEFETIFDKQGIDSDPTIYINISSKCKADDAPTGCENWFVMINVPSNQGQDWDALIQEARQNIISKINRILKTDIETLIANESILDPRSIEGKTSSFRGALYGSSSNNVFSAFFRHPNFSRSIHNLYFCGGSVHPGGGIPLCLLSAKIAVDQVGNG